MCSTRIAAPEATHGVWEWPLPPRNHEPNVSANIEQSTSGRWRCTSEACRGKLAGGGQLSEKSTAARRGSVYRRARTAWSLGASRESAVARELIVRSLGCHDAVRRRTHDHQCASAVLDHGANEAERIRSGRHQLTLDRLLRREFFAPSAVVSCRRRWSRVVPVVACQRQHDNADGGEDSRPRAPAPLFVRPMHAHTSAHGACR